MSAQDAMQMKHAMVVSIHHDGADAGLEILKQGGNAVDAAVATGFALAVVLPNAGNLGGGGFMLVRDHKGETHFLDFRERAPMAATRDMYLGPDGKVVPGLSTLGYKAIGVPGSVAGFVYAQRHFGKLTLKQDMAPAIRLAKEGFVLGAEQARGLHAANLSKFPESARIFQNGGKFYDAGDTFRQPELARTLERLAENPDEFYTGKMAKELAASVQSHGGLLTEADLAAYKVVDRKPLVGSYSTISENGKGHTYEVVTAPPPSSGGVVLLEVLHMLAGVDLPKLGTDRSEAQVHWITETFRRAYKDRNEYLGDPDYNTLPIQQMESMAYAAAWRKGIDPVKPTVSAELMRPAGFLPPAPGVKAAGHESTQTTHYSVVDADGNAVATTYTLNGLFGCGATAEGLGFLLNNEMDDFASAPDAPNMFGLIQGPANAIGPGHRPLSSMTPTIVTENGKVRLVLGSPGGSTISTTVANDLLSVLVNGLGVQAAADAPRFHQQFLPDVLDLEKAFPAAVADKLRQDGYSIRQVNPADEKDPGVWGDSELIEVDAKTGELRGGQDHRHTFGKVASY